MPSSCTSILDQPQSCTITAVLQAPGTVSDWRGLPDKARLAATTVRFPTADWLLSEDHAGPGRARIAAVDPAIWPWPSGQARTSLSIKVR